MHVCTSFWRAGCSTACGAHVDTCTCTGLACKCGTAEGGMHVSVQYGESVGVADWFQSFCAVHHACPGAAEAEEAAPGGKALRGRGKKQQHSGSQVPPPPSAMQALLRYQHTWHTVRSIGSSALGRI